MSDANRSDPHSRYERIYENCRTIWGKSEYRIFYDDEGTGRYQAFVKNTPAVHTDGQVLVVTCVCPSIGSALIELDRMLVLWAKFAVENGRPFLTNEQMMRVFGGRQGRDRSQQSMVARFWRSKDAGQVIDTRERLVCLQQRMGELQAEMEALEMEMLSCVEENE